MKHSLKKILSIALTGAMCIGFLPQITPKEVVAAGTQPYVTAIPGTEDLREEGAWDSSYLSVSGFASVEGTKVNDRSMYDTDEYRESGEYAVVQDAEQFLEALMNARSGKVKVIEVAADIELGWMALTPKAQEMDLVDLYGGNAKPADSENFCSFTNPDIMKYGVSEVNISDTTGLTIFSKSGNKLKHAEFKIQETAKDIVIRNLRFEGMWEWDDQRDGYYRDTPGGHKRLGFSNLKLNGPQQVWIDHCSFGIAFDGNIDIGASNAEGSCNGVSITWCTFGEESFEPGSMVYNTIQYLESIYQESKKNPEVKSFDAYRILRDNGYSLEDCMIYAALHSKTHLTGDGEKDYERTPKIHYTLAYNRYYNVEQRVPLLRQGSAHMYNCSIDNSLRREVVSRICRDKSITDPDKTVRDLINAEGIHTWNMFRCINARDGASVGADTCVFYAVDSAIIGSEKNDPNDANIPSPWNGYDYGYNHSLIVNSSITKWNDATKSMGDYYAGSSWDDKNGGTNYGDNLFVDNTWSWIDKGSIGNWTWKQQVIRDGGENMNEYIKVKDEIFPDDKLPYSYKLLTLEEMEKTPDPEQESALELYGGSGNLVMSSTDWLKTEYDADLQISTREEDNAEVTGITLDETETTLAMPETLQLYATVQPANAKNKTVFWSSSDPSVATVAVTGGGLVLPVSPGTTIITATTEDGEKTATCKVTVHEIPSAISILNLPSRIYVGDVYPLVAEIQPTGITTEFVRWATSSRTNASIEDNKVTALGIGTTKITAYAGITGKTPKYKNEVFEEKTVRIQDCPVTTTGVELDVTSAALTIGEDELTPITLQASVLPANATNSNVYWSSSNNEVASVEDGVVTPIGAGTAVITVTTINGGKTAEFVITIQEGTSSEVIYGDVNGNGEVDTRDAILLLRHLSDKEGTPLSGDAIIAANVDGSVDEEGTPTLETRDAIWILRYLADKDNVVFPVEKKE